MISTDRTPARPVRPRPLTGAVLAAAALAALAGCSSAAPPAAGSSPSATRSASATASGAPVTPASPSATTPLTPVTEVSASASAVPTLGQLAGVFAGGKGFGQVRPAEVDNGGDPTGLVTRITWQSWGGATATGTGTGAYDPPGQPVAASLEQPATIVAFRLGTCDGKLMYQAVEWYFPQHGQKFSAGQYENICAGTFVPNP